MSRARALVAAALLLTCCLGSAGQAEENSEKPLPVFNLGRSDFRETVANYRKKERFKLHSDIVDALKESIATPRGVWQFGKEWSVDEAVGKDDTFSLKVVHKRGRASQASVLLPPFDQYDEFIFPNYDLSLDLKTENASGNLFIVIKTEKPDTKQSVYKVPLKGTKDWQSFHYVTDTPFRMWKFDLILKFQGRGTLWLDNVRLRAVNLGPKDPKIQLEKVRTIHEGWKFKIDPDYVGAKQGWHKPGFDASSWQDISVVKPYDAQGWKKYNGYSWYRNDDVTLPEGALGGKLYLYFGGVDELGAVWVNGKFVGSHIFWELPFALEVTEALKPGRNQIAVKVFDCVYAGGIWGGVTLMRVPVPGEERPVEVRGEKHLFIDEHLIASKKDLIFTMNPPKKAGPAIKADKPWESQWVGFLTTVLQEQDKCRMYYTAQPAKERPRMAYAESKDGITWSKPDLGQEPYKRSKANNLLTGIPGVAGTVFVDPLASAAERYKLFISGCVKSAGWGTNSIQTLTSPDGLNWGGGRWQLRRQTDSQPQRFFDEQRNSYLIFLPGWEAYPRKRAIMRAEFGWVQGNARVPFNEVPIPRPVKGSELSWPLTREFPTVIAADETDPQPCDLFNPCVVKYPWAADVYLAFPSLHRYGRGKEHPEQDGTLEIQLAVSHDTLNWKRFRRPYVSLGKEGEPDSAVQIMAVGMVRRGDEIYQYYAGGRHTLATRPPVSEYREGTWKKAPGEPGIFRLVQRLDGFVSLDAADKEGSLETKLLTFEGKKLALNVRSEGEVRVALLGRDGKALKGFDLSDCDPVKGDSTAKTVTWNGKSDVSALAGTPVRLKFSLRNAKLYAFQFVK